jgi:hypothetical protein
MIENLNYPEYFEKIIFEIIEEEGLRSLDDLENYLQIQSEVIEKYREKYFYNEENINKDSLNKFDVEKTELNNLKLFYLLDDIKNCSKDLKLFTANLYLLLPSINNPLNEMRVLNNEKYPTYYQNFSDWNYSALVSCCYEKLYNFWDRIGDALSLYLNLEIKEHSITFPFVIDHLEQKNSFSNNESFIFLKSFKDNEFKEFNSIRRDIVHYKQFETKFKNGFHFDKKNLESLWEFKKNRPNYFKNQLEICAEGYKKTFELINYYI